MAGDVNCEDESWKEMLKVGLEISMCGIIASANPRANIIRIIIIKTTN